MERDNKGRFLKGTKPLNFGKRKLLDLDAIYKEHSKGKSILDISKKLKVSDRLIRIRLKEKGFKIRSKINHSQEVKDKISDTCKRNGIQPKIRYSGIVWNKGLTITDNRVKANVQGLLNNRKTQILPIKDTSIEVKLQSYLKQLGIQFYTHQYIKEIEHGYQCDILIPIQEGISKKTIIECFGSYWHNYPYSRQIDIDRCNELREQGYRVLVFWENEIKVMQLNDLNSVLIR